MHIKIKYGRREIDRVEEEYKMLFDALAKRFPNFLEPYMPAATSQEPVIEETPAPATEEIPLRKSGWEEILYSKTNEDFLKDVEDIINESLRERKQPINDPELRRMCFGKLAVLANSGVLIRGGCRNNEFQRNPAIRVKWV